MSSNFATILYLAVIIPLLTINALSTISQSSRQTPDLTATNQNLTGNSSQNFTPAAISSTSGRSAEIAEIKPAKSGRNGRMLDLDLASGDIDKSESLLKSQSISGARQSRILNEDIALDTDELQKDLTNDRSSKSGGKSKKKLSIQGFIPIVSLSGKYGTDSVGDEEDAAESNDDTRRNQNQYANGQEQIINSFGGKTSIGHASYGLQPTDDKETASRARKLGSGYGLVGSLANHSPTKLVSNLLSTHNNRYNVQAPSNIPPIMQNFDYGLPECFCVPFFQCKSGYLSEAQLSKSQLHQLLYQDRNQQGQDQIPQTPRTAVLLQQQQLTSFNGLTIQPQKQAAATLSSQLSATSSSTSEQQQINEAIYEQLRKTIESGNLDNLSQEQLSQMQQQWGFSQSDLNQYLDERSKGASDSSMTNSNTTNDFGTEERSLLRPFAGKRASANVCGVLRTCCKLHPNLIAQLSIQIMSPDSQLMQTPQQHHQQPNQQLLYPHNIAPANPGLSSSSSDFDQAQSIMQNQLKLKEQNQYQYLRPVSSQSQVASAYPTLQNSLPLGYQHQSQNHQPKFQDDYLSQSTQMQHMLPQHSNHNYLQPNRGNNNFFMEGRCGVRQATGITGRVQNQQVLENSAEFGEFPSQVAILKRLGSGENLFVCSAVLISNQWIATAAHCVRRYNVNDLKARLGEWDVQRDDEFYPFVEHNLRDIVVHPEFQSSNLINDIALLRIDALSFGEQNQLPHIAPACLPRPNESFDGQRCWVAGWGKNAFGQSGTFQSVLHKVDLPVLSKQTCEQSLRSTRLGPYFRLHQSAMCAGGEQGKDACEGDGGSGLYCVDNGIIKAVGLVSWGLNCGQAGVPGVYASMKTFVPWIESVVAGSGEENIYSGSYNTNNNNIMDISSLISERSKLAETNSTTSAPTKR